MSKTFTAFLLCFSLLAYGQLTTVNPTTFPFTTEFAHIFDDGSAYVMNKAWMIKVSNIFDPANTSVSYESAMARGPYPIFCFSKQHCICGTYRTTNGGKTWVNDIKLQQYPPQLCLEDGLCIRVGGSNGIWISDNYGKNWQGDLAYYQCDIVGQGDGQAFVIDGWRDTLYSISVVDSIRAIGSTLDFANMGQTINALAPVKDGFITVLNDTLVSRYDSTTASSTVIHSFPSAESLGNPALISKKADSIVIAGIYEVVYSFDDGQSWQVDSVDSQIRTEPNRVWSTNFERTHFTHGKVFFNNYNSFNCDAGVFAHLDLDSLKYKYTAGNTHFSGGDLIPLKQSFIMGSASKGDGFDAFLYLDKSGNILRKVSFPNPVQGYDFADSLHGFGIREESNTGIAYSTANGGLSWSIDTLLQPGIPERFHYTKDHNCIVNVLTYFTLYDHSFNQIFKNTQTAFPGLTDRYFLNCDTGLVITPTQLFYTDDGGLNFNPILSNNPGRYIWTFMPIDSAFFFATSSDLYTSKYLNGPYNKVHSGITSAYPNSFLTDDMKLFAQNYFTNYFDRYFHYSSDTGKTWQKAVVPLGEISEVTKVGQDKYLLTGKSGQIHILKSADRLVISPAMGREEPTFSTIHFFPNPATAEVQLQFSEKVPHKLQLVNVEGKMVLEHEIYSESHRMDIRHLESGMYYLKVISAQKQNVFRLLKMK